MTRSIIHRANTRGFSNLSWLKSHHSFSFGQYFNPIRMQFGKLRVLNDEKIEPQRGFTSTPLDNMEMVTIVLEGTLRHSDTLGNQLELPPGSVQCLSGGTGVKHSEVNDSESDILRLLHFRVLPHTRGEEPEYHHAHYDLFTVKDTLTPLVDPSFHCHVNQDAYVSWGNVSKGKMVKYKFHQSNSGIYLLTLDGMVQCVDHVAFVNDAIGVWSDEEEVEIKVLSDARFVVVEIPPTR
ncbi:pirin family protein [Halosquirtibacter laminarini]|uniref:Pirin family protein n=1 Tax=Halosquirtibacter laminarini TaxID=3374600 RepID=A0AC61NQ26_9BACT|nr:pirin family protein [Prolixibacteraceae bacterium]